MVHCYKSLWLHQFIGFESCSYYGLVCVCAIPTYRVNWPYDNFNRCVVMMCSDSKFPEIISVKFSRVVHIILTHNILKVVLSSSIASFIHLNVDDVSWLIDDLLVSSGQFCTDHIRSKNSCQYLYAIQHDITMITCCINCRRYPPSILHSAAVCAQDVRYTLVNGEHSLIGSCHRISHHLCLLVCCVERYHSSILPPCDSGSRPTSGGRGEGPGSLTIHQWSSSGHSWN